MSACCRWTRCARRRPCKNAWRNPTDKNLDRVIEMIEVVKELGMESCVTLGMLTREQTQRLKAAGLDYYNHNLDT